MIDNVTTIHGATTRGARPAVALLALTLPLLSACAGGSVQEALGLGKRSPDEFAVVSRAPLVVPPDFDLRPPRPGEPRPLVGTAGDQARATLLGETPATAARPAVAAQALDPASSAGQQALLGEAGGGNVDPEIRRRIAEENQALATVEEAMFTKLLKWREPDALSAVVDAPAEAERLLANRASGQPITTGDTPTVVQRRQSPLGALVEKVF